jgi:hypothetical protein
MKEWCKINNELFKNAGISLEDEIDFDIQPIHQYSEII